MVNRRPQLEIVAPSASPDEAAAVDAALEQFMRDFAPPPAPPAARQNPWLRAALLEQTGREPSEPSPWGDPHPWGSRMTHAPAIGRGRMPSGGHA